MRPTKTILGAVLALGLAAGAAHAAGDAEKPPSVGWSFGGMFGTYDRGALQRGFQVYKEVCAACHSMSLVSYRNLRAIGFNEDEVKAIAAGYDVQDGPNDAGEMFERPARPSDRFKAPYANENAGRAANNGAFPPDLSLMAKARENGPNYLNALLTGYTESPPGVTVPEGMHYNKYFPGHFIAMPPPLNNGAVTFADNTPGSVEQQAKDVTQFLNWAAEPELEERKRMGAKVILFLIVLTGILYAVKRKVWADVH